MDNAYIEIIGDKEFAVERADAACSAKDDWYEEEVGGWHKWYHDWKTTLKKGEYPYKFTNSSRLMVEAIISEDKWLLRKNSVEHQISGEVGIPEVAPVGAKIGGGRVAAYVAAGDRPDIVIKLNPGEEKVVSMRSTKIFLQAGFHMGDGTICIFKRSDTVNKYAEKIFLNKHIKQMEAPVRATHLAGAFAAVQLEPVSEDRQGEATPPQKAKQEAKRTSWYFQETVGDRVTAGWIKVEAYRTHSNGTVDIRWWRSLTDSSKTSCETRKGIAPDNILDAPPDPDVPKKGDRFFYLSVSLKRYLPVYVMGVKPDGHILIDDDEETAWKATCYPKDLKLQVPDRGRPEPGDDFLILVGEMVVKCTVRSRHRDQTVDVTYRMNKNEPAQSIDRMAFDKLNVEM